MMKIANNKYNLQWNGNNSVKKIIKTSIIVIKIIMKII